MPSGLQLTKEQRILKTEMCFCDFCNGYGFVLVNLPFYKKQISPFYDECIQCKGTGFAKGWWRVKETAVEKLVNINSSDFTRAQIQALSKKNLKFLYLNKKLSTYKIGKQIGINAAHILRRLNLYGIKLRNFKKSQM